MALNLLDSLKACQLDKDDEVEQVDCGSETEIPFFPTHELEIYWKYDKSSFISLFWFEYDFSQATYGRMSSYKCYSCTLIALITAEKIARRQFQMELIQNVLPYKVTRAFAEAIIDGNAVYCNLVADNRLTYSKSLSICEAMDAVAEKTAGRQLNIKEYKTIIQMSDLEKKLFSTIEPVVRAWSTIGDSAKQPNQYLFIVLIASNRSILLVFQKYPSIITLFDSHIHTTEYGSVIGQANGDALELMCHWIAIMFKDTYQCRTKCFELSFLKIKR